MSAIITGKVFWTKYPDLYYQDKKGKRFAVKESTAKIVMLAIGDSADDYGENSWQSFETIAEKTSLERRSVIRVVKALIIHHYLKVAGVTKYGTNNFTIIMSKLGDSPKRRAKNGRPKTSDSEAETSDSEAETSDSEAETSDSEAETSDSPSPYPSLNLPDTSIKEEGQPSFANAETFFQGNFGIFTQYDHELLGDLCDEHTPHWVIEAMKIAVKKNARNLAYTEAILKRWKTDGYGSDKYNGNGKNKKETKPAETPEQRAAREKAAMELLEIAREYEQANL